MAILQRVIPHFYVHTPLGEAEVHFVWTDDSLELASQFGCFQCDTKESWWWPQPYIRIVGSISGMRDDEHSPIHISDDMFETLLPHILRHKDSPFYERAQRRGN